MIWCHFSAQVFIDINQCLSTIIRILMKLCLIGIESKLLLFSFKILLHLPSAGLLVWKEIACALEGAEWPEYQGLFVPLQTPLKLKVSEILFTDNLFISCSSILISWHTEYGNIVVMLCAKFGSNWTNEGNAGISAGCTRLQQHSCGSFY